MISNSLRASRSTLLRMARPQPALTFRRTITASSVRSADLVQDMYLRELKNYKAPQVKATDAEGNVQKFSLPKAPKSPEETNIANDLQAYESQAVEVEGGAEPGAAPVEQDWFEEEVEEEKAGAH